MKPYGYAGDMDLMLMIYRNEERGRSVYAKLKNNVYQSLPPLKRYGSGVRGMGHLLRTLPASSKVMSLACGPAWEIQQVAEDGGLQFQIDLLDHDQRTVAYTLEHLRRWGMRHINCNAFDLIKGKTCFTLAETSGNSSRRTGRRKVRFDLQHRALRLPRCLSDEPMRGVLADP